MLGDAAWSGVEPAIGFWQTTPFEGHPATEKTEVRIAFDEKNIYLSVICFDQDPDGIIIESMQGDPMA